jgi:hypothetical protein
MEGQCTKTISGRREDACNFDNVYLFLWLKAFRPAAASCRPRQLRLNRHVHLSFGSHPEISCRPCPREQVTHACHILERTLLNLRLLRTVVLLTFLF